MQLDVESLRTLLAVLDHGGMTRAAEALDLTQSAVSWKIKRLEERVGRPLLLRDGHGIRPTPEGRSILDDARTIVELHDRAVVRLRESDGGSDLVGHVRVGSDAEVDELRMVSMLGRFTRTHPAATVEFLVDETERLTERVDRGDLDIAVIEVVDDDVEPDDEVLSRDRLVWATSRSARYEGGIVPLITIGECRRHRRLGAPVLTAAGIDCTVAYSVSSTSGVLAAIAAGLGVAMVPERHLGADLIEWPRAIEVEPLPHANVVVRRAPGTPTACADALVGVIVHELSGPSTVATGVA